MIFLIPQHNHCILL